MTVRLGGIDLDLRLEDGDLGAKVVALLTDSGFRPVAAPGGGGHRVTVRRQDGDPAPPGDGVEIARHRGIRVLRRDDGRLWIGDGTSMVELSLPGGVLEAALAARLTGASSHDEGLLIVLYSVLTLLRFEGLFPLHAGAVVGPGGGCLVIGASGSGKSSMVLRLVRAGWSFVADDSVVLQRRGGEVDAVAMRRDAYLREPDDAHFQREGWQACPEFTPVKYRVPLREAYPERAAELVTPRAVVFPSLTHCEGSRWLRCSPGEAMFSLLEHSTIGDLEPSQTPAHVALLRDLLLQAPAYRVLAGTDLRNNPAALAALMGEIVADATREGASGGPA